MAEKISNGIGRELRYFEYKFRKKQQTKKGGKKDKRKMGGDPSAQMAWSDSAHHEDITFESVKNEEIKKALPSNKGEEELQIQVALAMSREEESERSRQAESDDLRLKMALKESQKDAAPAPKPNQNQSSLLDMSFGAAPARAPQSDPWGAAASSSAPSFDPFGTPAPLPTSNPAPTAAFDPFSGLSTPAQNTVQAPTATNAFGNDPWGTQPTQPVPAPAPTTLDPWGATPASTAPATFSAPQFSAPPAFPAQSTNAWGNTNPTQQAFNPQPVQNGAAWCNPDPFSSPQSTGFDPFTGNSAPQTAATPAFTPSSDFNQPPAFDPLKDFDSLHIGGERAPSPVVLHHDFSMSGSVAKDIFPIQPMLAPQPVSNGGAGLPPMSNGQNEKPVKETEKFLGENSSLVNLDSWKPYQVPYVTKPLGTQSHNPFANSGPSKTLNQMKQQQQPVFQ